MNRMFAAAALVLTFGLSAGLGTANAAPLDPSHVSADAKWLVHIDFDAAHQSKVADNIREHILEHEKAKEALAKLKDELDMDPHQDLHGATLYSSNFKPQHGVLIIYAKANKEKLIANLKKKDDFSESTDGGNTFYSWTEHKGKKHSHAVVAVFPKEGMGVFSADMAGVKAALEVIGGKGGLATSSPLAGEVPKGTVLQAAAIDVSTAELPAQCAFAKQIDQLHVAIGESDGNVFDHTKVDMTNEDVAKQGQHGYLRRDGFRAMGQIRFHDKPEMLKLVDGLKVDASGKTFTVDWQASTDDVIKAGDQIRAQIKEHGKLRDKIREHIKEKSKN